MSALPRRVKPLPGQGSLFDLESPAEAGPA